MGLPDDLQTLNRPYFGEPFVQVTSTNDINPNTLDWSYFGEPFWAISASISGIRSKSSVSAYLEGYSNDRETSLSVYIYGRDPCTKVSSYTAGNFYTKSKQKAYTNATKTLIFESFPVFLEGQILDTTSTHAYVVGPRESVVVSTNAYLYGVNRNSISAYLDGVGASTDYITLTGGTLSKRFKVLQQDYDDGTEERIEEVHKTISGGIEHSVGDISTTWRMIIRARAYETDDRYGTRDNLEYFYSQHQVIFVDHRGYEYKVSIIGKLTKNLITTVVEGGSALYLYRLELIKDKYA